MSATALSPLQSHLSTSPADDQPASSPILSDEKMLDSGFDMVPRLGNSLADTKKWNAFLDDVKDCYRQDPKVEVKWNYILFKAGKHMLLLPTEGHKFMRFSSMMSAGIADPKEARDYIKTVSTMAKDTFGSHVLCWDSESGTEGKYDWNQVHASIRTYDEVGHLLGFADLTI
jgi:hypothetical protein